MYSDGIKASKARKRLEEKSNESQEREEEKLSLNRPESKSLSEMACETCSFGVVYDFNGDILNRINDDNEELCVT